jgi:hypothetical protein
VRLALKVVMQSDGDFVDVILLYPLNTILSRSHSRSGRHGEEKNLLTLAGT